MFRSKKVAGIALAAASITALAACSSSGSGGGGNNNNSSASVTVYSLDGNGNINNAGTIVAQPAGTSCSADLWMRRNAIWRARSRR